ncbi:MAG: hypothetical protein QNJ16_13015 [Rhodobacter sp.]|nr:hypothetical protein [Rhodobacter sp.]
MAAFNENDPFRVLATGPAFWRLRARQVLDISLVPNHFTKFKRRYSNIAQSVNYVDEKFSNLNELSTDRCNTGIRVPCLIRCPCADGG